VRVIIKPASTDAEIKAAYKLVCELADHEGSREFLKISESMFLNAASGPTPQIEILIALAGGEIVGTVTYFQRFHIWNGNNIFELDDLYVSANARGHGIGTKLLTTLGQQAKAAGAPVKWQVNAANHGAIALYKRLGANFRESGICFWLPENMP